MTRVGVVMVSLRKSTGRAGMRRLRMPGARWFARREPVACRPPAGHAACLHSLEQDLRLLRIYAFVTYPFACVPFLYLFFCQHGLDLQGFGEVVAVYYLAMFIAEVPTGILADRFGPKPMLVLGPLLLAVGFGSLVLFPTYPGFVAGEGV